MHHEVKKNYSYRVCYKANSDYGGNYYANLESGVHGEYGPSQKGLAGAREGAKSCKDWISNEKRLVEVQGGNGQTRIDVVEHNNVIIWIEEYLDGNFTGKEIDPWTGDVITESEQEPAEEKPSKSKKQKELATA